MSEAAKGIRVTATDLEDGETGTKDLGPGDYCLIVADPLYLDSTVKHSNGTVILTLKREKGAS